MSVLVDTYQRQFYYLRLSVTDVCNFRCQYCLPEGYRPDRTTRQPFLNLDEIGRVARAFSALGTHKIRLTGGEPTMRRDFAEIIAVVRQQDAIKKIAMTTNGYRLAKEATRWRQAGLTDVNVSVDSLDARQFHSITGQDKFHQVMAGIDACFEAGFSQVKVNAVLMRGLTQQLSTFLAWIQCRPIQLRFIELMETGDGRAHFQQHHLRGDSIRQQLLKQGWSLRPTLADAGPAQIFSHPDYCGEIGLIMPYEQNFCQNCNRLRVSSTGKLHLCLFGEQGIELRDLLQHDAQLPELTMRIADSLQWKKQGHFLHQGNTGITQNLSFIGG